MHVSPNKEIAPEWITHREIILDDLTPGGRALFDAIKAAPPTQVPTIKVRSHLTERAIIIQQWEAKDDPVHLPYGFPLQQELDRFVAFFGLDALDQPRIETWKWGGLHQTDQDRRETPEEYLNRNAAEITRLGEIVSPVIISWRDLVVTDPDGVDIQERLGDLADRADARMFSLQLDDQGRLIGLPQYWISIPGTIPSPYAPGMVVEWTPDPPGAVVDYSGLAERIREIFPGDVAPAGKDGSK